MRALTLANLVAYSLQIATVAAAAAALPWLFRLRAADARHTYWRAVVLLCLLLPFVQSRQVLQPSSTAATTLGSVVMTTIAPTPAAAPVPAAPVNRGGAIAAILITGVALRVLWIAGGLLYLRRMRSVGSAAPEDADVSGLQQTLGTRAAIRIVAGLRQPVTFGVLRPVVLLPDTLDEHPADVRRAVVAHELLHVQRRDWIWILVEETIRAAFWFHPAMWWLISKVQLSREEVVDELSVLATGRRRTYAQALLAFADSAPLSPAPAFARRRHLLRRLALLSTEAVMSSKRIVLTGAVMAGVVLAGTWSATGAFPLRAPGRDPAAAPQTSGSLNMKPGPLEQRAVPITPENPIPRRLASAGANYPGEAAAIQATGTVTLRITLDELGRVAEARPTSMTAQSTGADAFSVSFSNLSALDLNKVIGQATITSRPGALPKTVESLIGSVLLAFIESARDAVRQWRYDSPANGPLSFDVMFTFRPDAPPSGSMPPPPPPPPPPGPRGTVTSASADVDPSWTVDGAVRIGGAVKPPTKIRHVPPVYPPIAQSARVSGVVIVEVRLDPDGHVSRARVLKSIPLLDQAAIDAVLQWEFTPVLLNGAPVPVLMTVAVHFALE